MTFTTSTIIWVIIGIAFQYFMIYFATAHANDKQDKKIEELKKMIGELTRTKP